MYKLYIISGASGIGKTTLLFKLAKMRVCDIAPKYSNRPQRAGLDDVIHVDDIYDPKYSCDIIYELYYYRYGINTQEIKNKLFQNNQILIISNIEALIKIKQIFKEIVVITNMFLPENHFRNLIKTYISRENLKLSRNDREELISVAGKISRLTKEHDEQEFLSLNNQFCKIMKNHITDHNRYLKFIMRYESWTRAFDYYCSNKSLYDYSFELNDSDFYKLYKLIKKNY